MFNRHVVIFVLIAVLLFAATFSIADDRIPNLKGKWQGVSYLSIDSKKIHTSKYVISITISQQTGLEFSGNIELKDNEVTRIRNFSAFLNEKEGYIWYFGMIVEDNDLNVGYLLTKNIMKIQLKNFQNNPAIVVCRLSREKPIPE